MKKFFLCFVIILFVGLFSSLWFQETVNYNSQIKDIEKKIGMDFNLLLDFEANETYEMLEQTAKELNLNLFRPVAKYEYDPDKKCESMQHFKYIFLANDDSKYFDYVKIISGEKFTTETIGNNDLFMSTKKDNSENQIAVLKKFLNSNDITIAPLADSYNYLTINGKYFVETDDKNEYDAFLNLFAEKLNNKYGKYGYHFEGNDFVPEKPTGMEYSYKDNSIIVDGMILLIITVVLMCYYIFNETKRIAVLKLNGHSNTKILAKLIFYPITKLFVCINFILFILGLIFADIHFCYLNLIYQLIAYFVLGAFSLGTMFYISIIKLSSAIKNEKHTQSVWILSLLVKAVCCAQAVIMIVQISDIYNDIDKQKVLIKNWESVNNYGVLYRVISDYEFREGRGEFYINSDKLYLYLNKLGALYINASTFEQDVVEHNILNNKYSEVKANVNYLNRFPVYDVDGKKVEISEDDTDYILLVPEKYKSEEEDLKERLFSRGISETGYLDGPLIGITEWIGIPVSDEIKNQKLKIIWVKNDQWLFSMNSDVFPSEENMIKEPIIQVLTEKNSHLTIREIDTNWGENVPLKVKLTNQDSKQTYQEILPELERLHLDDNYVHLTSLNEKLMDRISEYHDGIWFCAKRLIFNLLVLIILIAQSVFIMFDKNKSKLIVRDLHGFGFIKAHIEYVYMFLFNLAFQIIIYNLWIVTVNFARLILHYVPYTTNINSIYLLIALSIVEFFVSILISKKIENKNKTKILKGGL